MIGKQQLSLGANELMSGVAASDFSTDAALSNQSSGINPFIKPGMIKATASAVDKSTGLETDPIIATCEEATGTYAKIAVDAGGDVYSLATDGALADLYAGSSTYTFGITDIVAWRDAHSTINKYNFISSTNDVTKFTQGSGLTENWFSSGVTNGVALNSAVPHPMVVFNGLLWIANGNNLISVSVSDTTFTATLSALLLDTTDVVQALHIDPATGYMMVSAMRIVGSSHSTQSYVYIFDAFSTLPRRTIPVIDGKITGFCSVNGTVFVGCENRLAVWNGNGVTYLRTLKNASTATNSDLLYKHHMASYGNILFYADGATLMSYGEPVGLQRKGFFPISANPVDTSHLGAISLLTAGVIGFGWITSSTPKWYAVDITLASAGAGIIYFNNIYVPRPIFIRRVRIITDGITTTTGIGGVSVIDESTATNTPQISTFVVASGTKYMFDFDFMSLKVQALQPKITIGTQAFGVARVIIFYDVSE